MAEVIVKRDDIYSKIQKLLINTNYNKKLCMIQGEFGVGKSTLLDIIQNENDNVYVLNIDLSKVTSDTPYTLKSSVLNFLIEINKKKELSLPEPEQLFSVLRKLLNIPLKVSNEHIALEASFNIGDVLDELYQAFTHNNYKTADETYNDPFWIHLARIVCKICDNANKELYIIVDDFDRLESHTIEFINSLLNMQLKITLIVSGDKSCERFDQLLQTQFVTKSSNDQFKYELSCFSFDETNQYISKKFSGHPEVNIELITSAYQFTRGLPFLLSLVTADVETLKLTHNDQISPDKQDKWELYVKKLLFEKSSLYKEILELIAINQNEIHIDVLEKLICKSDSSSNSNELFVHLDRMICEKLVVDSNDILKLYTPAVGEQLRHIVKQRSHFTTKRILMEITNEYLNMPSSKDDLHQCKSLIYLNLELGNIEESFQYITKYIGKLRQTQQFINAISFINKILLNPNFGSKKEYKTQLMKELCLLHFLSRNNLAAIDTFKKLDESDLLCIAQYGDDIELFHNIAMAYYYENDCTNAIYFANKLLTNPKTINTYHYHQAMTLISSSLDLNGSYKESKSYYDEAMLAAQREDDISQIGSYKMLIQMISNDFDECISELSDAVNIFEHQQTNLVKLIKSLNNLGVEYLMNGEVRIGLSNLHKAETLLEKCEFLEDHFIFNNIALCYLFDESEDLEKANHYLIKAMNHSISPLQKAYTHSNYSVLLKKICQNSKASEYFKLSLNFAQNSPDPYVLNYIHYNCALNEYYNGNVLNAIRHFNSMGYLPDKIQTNCLEQKREKLANELNLSYKYNYVPTTRRKLFAQYNWELCELMFYN